MSQAINAETDVVWDVVRELLAAPGCPYTACQIRVVIIHTDGLLWTNNEKINSAPEA
jgi:hypothetical protein